MKVKICGFMDPADVGVACELGADMIGAILVPNSARCLTLEKTKKIFAAVNGAAKVAVVMPRSFDELLDVTRELEPDYLQIHPTIQLNEKDKEKLGVGLIMVVPVPTGDADKEKLVEQAMQAAEVADIILIDTKGPGGGGTGKTHDWSISRAICDSVEKPVLLAGGLNPSNVGQAIKAVRPHGVDVATGVETKPGKKDPKLMKEFISAARG